MATATPALTARQQGIYDFVRRKILSRGYGPTIREIRFQFGIRSPNGVMCHLKALEKKGFIKREPHVSRGIELTDNPIQQLRKQCAQLSKDWRAGHIQVSAKASKAKAASIAQTFDALRSQIRAIR